MRCRHLFPCLFCRAVIRFVVKISYSFIYLLAVAHLAPSCVKPLPDCFVDALGEAKTLGVNVEEKLDKGSSLRLG